MGDWIRFCRGVEGMSVVGDHVEVATNGERRQRVMVRETTEAFELTGVVVRPSMALGIPDLALRAWRRNRAMQLVGFRIDRKGRLIGESWVPKAGLTRDEFLLYIQRVADECDLFEYHLTGRDRE